MILSRIDPYSEKLERLYLQLVEIYLILEKEKECSDIVSILENKQNPDIQQELGNLLRKHNNLELCIEFYKKVLLLLKRKHLNYTKTL